MQLFWKCQSKTEIFISLSYFTFLNKNKKLNVHERENLVFERNYGTKGCKLDTSISLKNLWLENDSDFSDTSLALGSWMYDYVQKQLS